MNSLWIILAVLAVFIGFGPTGLLWSAIHELWLTWHGKSKNRS